MQLSLYYIKLIAACVCLNVSVFSKLVECGLMREYNIVYICLIVFSCNDKNLVAHPIKLMYIVMNSWY